MLARQLRLEKGWSQSQLAEYSGLSLRTIQRIEKGHKPTIESLKALAAVFETDTASLLPEHSIDESKLSDEELEELEHVREIRKFFLDLVIFLAVMPILFLINWASNSYYNWAGATAFAWGICLIVHAYHVFDTDDLFGKGSEKRQLEKRLKRKL